MHPVTVWNNTFSFFLGQFLLFSPHAIRSLEAYAAVLSKLGFAYSHSNL